MNTTGLICLTFAMMTTMALDSAHAQIFTCKTDSGRTITSDRPIPECSKRAMRELRTDGALKRTIAPPMTHAEREARERQKIVRRAESMRRRQEQARDRALTSAYPTMADLENMRERQIGALQMQIDKTYQRMVVLHGKLKATQAASRAYPPGQAPGLLKQKIAQIASAILSEDSLVKAHLTEQQQIRAHFDKDARRLQTLLDRMTAAKRLAGG